MPDNELRHYGVEGMKWGVRKKRDVAGEILRGSPGALRTEVTTKHGEKISVVKEPPGKLVVATARLFKRKPENNVSAMRIVDSSGKKVGSFQVWNDKEYPKTIRGEWLEVNSSSQGKGYSKAAIGGLMIAARKDPSIDYVRLQVPADAAPAKHIYGGLGFRKDKDIGDPGPPYGQIEDWVADVRTPTVRHSIDLMHGTVNVDSLLEKAMKEVVSILDSSDDSALQHYGVKGMKWGVRKANRNAPRAVATKQKPGDYIQSKGGKRQPGSEDAFRTQTYRQMAKASTTDSLSNKELQALVNRMNLEQNYARLKKQEDRRTRGKRAVGNVINLIKGNPDLARNAADNVKTAFDAYEQHSSAKASRSPRAVSYPVVESTVVRR